MQFGIGQSAETLAIEGAWYGIRVNAVAPGALTRMTGDVLGDGTFGRVYEGRDHRFDRRVAIKVLRADTPQRLPRPNPLRQKHRRQHCRIPN